MTTMASGQHQHQHQHRHQLSRLSIPPIPGPQYHGQVPLYSPAIQSAIQFLQTPIQPSFFPPPPGPTHPSLHPSHRHQPSVALASAGIHPPPGIPLNSGPFGGGPQFSPFQPRSRRQPSISTGGPPKAQLGGVGKNYRPPSPTAAALANVAAQSQKGKKVTVNLPNETVLGGDGDGEPPTRTRFARTPIPLHLIPPQPSIPPPDVISAIIHPEDRVDIPGVIDVFLPGRSTWDAVRQKFIEDKLEKLGVEKGTGSNSNLPHIHAPHARAASISSPADPALLYFKLNKLQQAQKSQPHSPSLSPQPPLQLFDIGTSPPPIIQSTPPPPVGPSPLRHGHSLSLAAAPFIPSRHYLTSNDSIASKPFAPGTSIGFDAARSPDARSDPGAPTDQSLAPPAMPARADSRPDFVRGFGLDITEEEEEEEEEQYAEQHEESLLEEREEEQAVADASHIALAGGDDAIDMELDVDEADAEVGSITTAAQSRVHSRHVSRLSAALSLRSVNGNMGVSEAEAEREREGDPEDDAIGEWTGSEDLRTGTETAEDEESIGEWSNPSDEERARQERQQRRLIRRAHRQQQQESIQVPRRIPNFPHPPINSLPLTSLLSQPRREAEDDMISNPSDDHTHRFRSLPIPPSSRPPSSRLPIHDPARSHPHSRVPSTNVVHPQFPMTMAMPIQAPVPKRTDVLNPHAKPFVFGGATRLSGSFNPGTFVPPVQQQEQQQPQHLQPLSLVPQRPPAFGHVRGASLGKPLNAGAPVFKPATFTFTPPPDVPKFPAWQHPLPPSTLPSSPPLSNVETGFVRAQQGREKRQRRGSAGSVSTSEGSEDGREAMTSFKFPQESPVRKSAPLSPAQRREPMNATVPPLILPGLGGINLSLGREPAAGVKSPVSDEFEDDESDNDGDEDEDEASVDAEHELPVPPSMKARRAPIPLDFKHPVSTNTVPAGLFKALANGNVSIANGSAEGEERTRRTVRSRLGSREIFEHAARPSLDDLHVPAISHKASRGRLVTDPGLWDDPSPPQEQPQLARDRRASLPAMGSARSSLSDSSVHPPDVSGKIELQHFEERLEALLESKLDDFREEMRALRSQASATKGGATSEAALNDLVSLFRAQLQESAARGLDDSQMEARGELDFQLVKDIVEQGHAEARAVIQKDLDRVLRCVEALQSPVVTPINGGNTEAVLEEYHVRTHNTVVGAVAPIAARLEALERTRSHTPLPVTPVAAPIDQEGLVRELRAAIVPHIAAMRPEPVDYELLTEQLSQAVKPHISQLIDLASDKRETAGLIVDRLIPVLPNIYPPAVNAFDMPTIVAQITAEVRRIVGPLDAHEIKEQVSDLVVERLDSRLAVRDRLLDSLSSKLADGFDNVLKPVKDSAARVEVLVNGQETLSTQARDLASASANMTTLLSSLPQQLTGVTVPLRDMLAGLVSTAPTFGKGLASSEDFTRIDSAVESLSKGQQGLQDKTAELLALHQTVLSRLTDLPDSMSAIIEAAQVEQAELLAQTVTKEDFEEVRKMVATNADLQIQLDRMRSQFGALRVEKDVVMERLAAAESERDQLRDKVGEIQAVNLLRATDVATSQARTMELERAISQSLERLKTSDERLLELEKLNRDSAAEKEALLSKVYALEAKAGFDLREKEAAVEALIALQKEHDAPLAQQTHWEELRRATEQVGQLTALFTQTQTSESELKELRRFRDHSKVLEGENAALLRRLKEQEARATSSDRAVSSVRTSLAQAQQRVTEWEQQANAHAAALAEAEAALESANDRAVQREADHSLVQLQLEEQLDEARVTKRDREAELLEQLARLEARVAQLQQQANASRTSTTTVTSIADMPPRSDSRLSTIYPSRSTTPTTSVNGHRTNTPPTSVWDSMHAPTASRSRHSKPQVLRRAVVEKQSWTPRVPSPTPSVVSVTPTLGDDGWYE